MVDPMEAVDQIAFLARSKARVHVLEQLRDHGPATQRDLRDRLDASRSTVTRSLTALEDRGWIERDDRSYRLSPKGEVVTDEFLSLRDSVRAVDELSPFLQWFPYAEFPLDLSALREADITSAASPDPYAPARKQTELIETEDSFRGFLPSLDIEGTRVVHEQIVNGGFEAEVVVPESVERTIASGEYAELFGEQLATGRLTVFVLDDDVPFYLGLAGDTVQIGVEDDEGFPRALLETTAESIREWATDVYESHRERSRVKPADDF
ncbi:helix-turn-helix transcriptional regulator [Halosimplex salinum]|uniref:helix-turn-helix transcriptional regulator n=1 Tax=Halosimplex salinum TaxID=1710538 RepID=UPI000F46F241|nr:MarR family transcriptional regulator [Halosimplex salinum]